MKMLGIHKVRIIEGIVGRRVRCAYKGSDRWVRVHYSDGYGVEPRWVDYATGETLTLCTAAHAEGWQCEGRHIGGDVRWEGTSLRREVDNRIVCILLQHEAGITARFIAAELDLSISHVRAHLVALEVEGMAMRDRNRWPHRWHS